MRDVPLFAVVTPPSLAPVVGIGTALLVVVVVVVARRSLGFENNIIIPGKVVVVVVTTRFSTDKFSFVGGGYTNVTTLLLPKSVFLRVVVPFFEQFVINAKLRKKRKKKKKKGINRLVVQWFAKTV